MTVPCRTSCLRRVAHLADAAARPRATPSCSRGGHRQLVRRPRRVPGRRRRRGVGRLLSLPAAASASRFAPGTHTATARAVDAAATPPRATPVAFVVEAPPAPAATFDATLGVPACAGGSTLRLGAACSWAAARWVPSRTRPTRSSASAPTARGHLPLGRVARPAADRDARRQPARARARQVQVTATVWAFGASNVSTSTTPRTRRTPVWTLVGTAVPPGAGRAGPHRLIQPDGGRRAAGHSRRLPLRCGGAAHVPERRLRRPRRPRLRVRPRLPADPPATTPTFKAPRCAGFGTQCDSGTLLVGRASLGPEPNAPNTTFGECPDGNWGEFHVEPSIDRIQVVSADGTPLERGTLTRVDVTVFASTDCADRAPRPLRGLRSPQRTVGRSGLTGSTSAPSLRPAPEPRSCR